MAASALGLSELASRYALALFDLADEAKTLDVVAGELRAIKAALAESRDFRRLVRSPVFSREEQGRAVGAVLDKAEASDLTRRFVSLVAANRRLFVLDLMIDAFLGELARRRGEMTAQVVTAHALTDEQEAKLTDQIKRQVGAKVAIDVTVDPSLLGGMVVRVGSRMIDTSLRTKLSKLALAMKGVA